MMETRIERRIAVVEDWDCGGIGDRCWECEGGKGKGRGS